jgi:lipopolysaccharide assembly outer membrane protein LptD (OstA)
MTQRLLRCLRFWGGRLVPLLLLAAGPTTFAALPIDFKADHYSRDLKTDTLEGEGNAWLKQGPKEIFADKIKFDFKTKEAVASGNVHIKDGEIDIWATRTEYFLESDRADIENGTISVGQLVITGAAVHRLDSKHFEVDDGSYSNCNVDITKNPNVGKCEYDWKIYGHHFSIEMEGYAHINDAILFVNKLPLFYAPYFIAPIKTKRQSGFLMPKMNYQADLGNGFSLPYFWVLAPWLDLTIDPMYYSSTGYHLGLSPRYAYSNTAFGNADIFLLQRRFTDNRDNPGSGDPTKNYSLGFIGEWAVNARNEFSLGGRAYSRQILRYVSQPYYTYDYAPDLKMTSEPPSLRSKFAVTVPSDDWVFTGQVQHHQSLVVTDDAGIDQGEVTQTPELIYSKMTTPFWGSIFSYEAEARFTNFWRPHQAYDAVPSLINPTAKVRQDPNPAFHLGDYIRTGRRLQLEPRLIVNVPMPSGFQFQPIITAGTLIYNFDVPTPRVIHQDYFQAELPASLYLSRTFETGIPGYEKINHVFQPRVIFSTTPYLAGNLNDPFFYNDDGVQYTDPFFNDPTHRLSNPRFDILDEIAPVEYFRVELINRLRRKTGSLIERFLLFQVSEQFNTRTYADNPLYATSIGPLEVLVALSVWRLNLQLQGTYNLLATLNNSHTLVNEREFSGSLTYSSPGDRDLIALNARFATMADPSSNASSLTVAWNKGLPTFFDLNGGLEFDFNTKSVLLGYRLGFVFGPKPRSCWGATLSVGRNTYLQPFLNFAFTLDFGSPTYVYKPT